MSRWAAPLAIVAWALAGCGGTGGGLVVGAASSLTVAFERYSNHFTPGPVRLAFAGSDQLAAQIRQGARPDVFASADTMLPRKLHREGLVGRPIAFARNRLVIAVPSGAGTIGGLADLARPGVRVAVGTRSVPAGAYAHEVLARLRPAERRAIAGNVATREPEVTGIVGKLTEGVVDAGLVYATDVRAAGGQLRAIPLPRRVRPDVTYSAAVVRGDANPRAARRWISGLLSGPGAAALRAAGFMPPPR